MDKIISLLKHWWPEVFGFIALVSIVVYYNDYPFFYDEPAYLDNVRLLKEHGLSKAYLLAHKGSAGITYPIIHFLLSPITGLQPHWVRLVNVIMLVLVMGFTGKIYSISSGENNVKSAGFLMLSIPMTYIITGMALTEMPALFFLTVSLYLLLIALERSEALAKTWLYVMLSAICMSAAVLGRQPYLLLVFTTPLFLLYAKKSQWKIVAAFIVGALIPAVMVFNVWGGLVAPDDAMHYDTNQKGKGFMIEYVLLCLAYFASCILFTNRLFFVQVRRTLITPLVIGFIAFTAVNYYFPVSDFIPAETVMKRTLAGNIVLMHILISAFQASLLLLSGYFVVSLFYRAWERRRNSFFLFSTTSLLAIAFSCGFISHQFSSRYAAQASIFLVLVCLNRFEFKLPGILMRILGMTIGCICLLSYYWFPKH